MEDGVISLSKFLSRYAGVCGKDLKKITHDEVKALFPHIRRTSFDFVENNPALLRTGGVLLVDDGKKVIPYFVPRCESYEERTELLREEVKDKKKYKVCEDYANMSIYELRCMLERKFNSNKRQSKARKELNSRGVTLHKKYNRSKIKNEREEE